MISFKPARYYRKPLYGSLLDSSSSEDDEIASVTAKNIEDDNQHIAQSAETSDDGDSLSYGSEDTRTSSNMGTDKQMEAISSRK